MYYMMFSLRIDILQRMISDKDCLIAQIEEGTVIDILEYLKNERRRLVDIINRGFNV